MNNRPKQQFKTGDDQVPNQEQIENLLLKINPSPSKRFFQQQDSQPWNSRKFNPLLKLIKIRRLPASIVLVLVVVIILSLASPSLNALANRLAQFFIPASNDLVTIQVPLADISDPEISFSKTIPEAADQAGFEVKIPFNLPEGFVFSGAVYHSDRQAVILNYEFTQGNILRISQRPVGVEYQSISVNATVETVQVGTVVGEYVVGGWKAIQPEDPTSTQTISLQAIWDPDANIHFLRWEENDILFEIISIGHDLELENHLDKIDLIVIAESLQ